MLSAAHYTIAPTADVKHRPVARMRTTCNNTHPFMAQRFLIKVYISMIIYSAHFMCKSGKLPYGLSYQVNFHHAKDFAGRIIGSALTLPIASW